MESSRLKLRGTFRNIVSWTCFLLLQGKSEDLWFKVAACLFGLFLSSLQPWPPPRHSRGELQCSGLLLSHSVLNIFGPHTSMSEESRVAFNLLMLMDTSHLSRWPNFIHKSCHHPLNLLEFPHRILPLLFFFSILSFFWACVLLASPLHFLYWLNKWLMWVFLPVITTSQKTQMSCSLGSALDFPPLPSSQVHH